MSDKMRETVARAIWNIRRDEEDRCDMELEDMGVDHSVWAEADAAIGAFSESLVIELPDDGIEDCRKEWPERGEKYGYDTFDTGYLYACKKHEKAIEAAGLKVKP